MPYIAIVARPSEVGAAEYNFSEPGDDKVAVYDQAVTRAKILGNRPNEAASHCEIHELHMPVADYERWSKGQTFRPQAAVDAFKEENAKWSPEGGLTPTEENAPTPSR